MLWEYISALTGIIFSIAPVPERNPPILTVELECRCPPCRGFTPKLAESYTAMQASGKSFEIVFVSSDKDQGTFDEYFGYDFPDSFSSQI
jgi:hypothetical protein